MRTWFDSNDIVKMLEDIRNAQLHGDSWICDHNYECDTKYLHEDGHRDCALCAIDTFARILKEGDHDILEYFFKNEDYPDKLYASEKDDKVVISADEARKIIIEEKIDDSEALVKTYLAEVKRLNDLRNEVEAQYRDKDKTVAHLLELFDDDNLPIAERQRLAEDCYKSVLEDFEAGKDCYGIQIKALMSKIDELNKKIDELKSKQD